MVVTLPCLMPLYVDKFVALSCMVTLSILVYSKKESLCLHLDVGKEEMSFGRSEQIMF